MSQKFPKKAPLVPETAPTKTLKHKSSIDSNELRIVGYNDFRESQSEKRRRLHPPQRGTPEGLHSGRNIRTDDRSRIHSDSATNYHATQLRAPLPYGGNGGVIITSTAEVGARGLEFVAPIGIRSDLRQPNRTRTGHASMVLSSTESPESDDATSALQAFTPQPAAPSKGSKHHSLETEGPEASQSSKHHTLYLRTAGNKHIRNTTGSEAGQKSLGERDSLDESDRKIADREGEPFTSK
jgi:hypothetical protein